MKNTIIIIASLLAIFALLYFSNPPSIIHYLFAFILLISVLKLGYGMFKKKV